MSGAAATSAVRLGVLPGAGRGVRAYPRTEYVPKVLLEVAGKPLLVRNIEILRDELQITDLIVLIGHLGDAVRALIGDGSELGVRVRYVEVGDPGIGLARGLYLAKGLIDEPFVTILGDELYLGSNHRELRDLSDPLSDSWDAVCAYQTTDDPRLVKKNYSIEIDDEGFVRNVEEKPEAVTGSLLGCGTYVFRPSIFDAIDRTPPSARSGRVELTDVLQLLVNEGRRVRAFALSGSYVNINSTEDQNTANYVARSLEFDSYKISVVVPAWNEEESIGYVVREFAPLVDEVIVADNVSQDRTAEIARELGARVVSKPLRGYGEALTYGMDEAKGDILILVEADHSFRAKDLGKIIEYMRDADMVLGTRTTREMVEQGTNMRGVVRWANVAFGKLIEILWWSQEPRFTDVGCTYRGIWRDVYQKIRPRLEGIGPEFAPELTVEVLRERRRVIEIPVSYYPRVGGESKHSGSYPELVKTALRMLRLVLRKRFRRS